MTRVLEVSGLEGGYGKVQIMNNVDLYVDKGEFVTVIGPNGCGKSTFIKIVFGIATYYKGSVKHKGLEVSGWRTDALVNRGIAYVPQVDNVFPSLSVRENFEMGGINLPVTVLDNFSTGSKKNIFFPTATKSSLRNPGNLGMPKLDITSDLLHD